MGPLRPDTPSTLIPAYNARRFNLLGDKIRMGCLVEMNDSPAQAHLDDLPIILLGQSSRRLHLITLQLQTTRSKFPKATNSCKPRSTNHTVEQRPCWLLHDYFRLHDPRTWLPK